MKYRIIKQRGYYWVQYLAGNTWTNCTDGAKVTLWGAKRRLKWLKNCVEGKVVHEE